MYNRLLSYFDSNNILSKNQFGFRKNHSTLLALLQILDKLSNAFNERKHIVGVFLDLSKAFHTVDHNILFDKSAFYGVRGLPLDCLKNYFANRSQYIMVLNIMVLVLAIQPLLAASRKDLFWVLCYF